MKSFCPLLVRGLIVLGALSSAALVRAATPDNGTAAALGKAGTGPLSVAFLPDALHHDVRYRSAGISSSNDAIDGEIADLSPAADPTLAGNEATEGSGAVGQMGGRRRRSYGRSRYQDRLHNADGSTKIAFIGGAGLNLPVGNTGKFYTPSYDIEVGAGYNFNRMFGVLGEVHYDHAGVTGGAIGYEYNNLIAAGVTQSQLAGFDANSHVLSFTVNPVISFADRDKPLGAYITGGGGYYRKTTNFTLPSVGTACNYYYCYQYGTNVNVDTYTASGVGANLGFGLSYRISEFSNERIFVEARYHWLRLSDTNNVEFFPFNRRNSEYVPINVGIRF